MNNEKRNFKKRLNEIIKEALFEEKKIVATESQIKIIEKALYAIGIFVLAMPTAIIVSFFNGFFAVVLLIAALLNLFYIGKQFNDRINNLN